MGTKSNNKRLYIIIKINIILLLFFNTGFVALNIYNKLYPEKFNFLYSKYFIITSGILFISFFSVLFISVYFSMRIQIKLEEKIDILTVTDDLTSLLNRSHFFQKLDEEFERAKRYNYPLSLIIANIDSFKTYNITYGLKAGDIILQNIAYIIKPSCRVTDIVARYSDEEFSILVPNTDDRGALVLAEKLRSRVEEYKYHKDARPVTITLGISSVSADSANSADILIHNTEIALHKAREIGSNRSHLHKPV